MRSTPLSATSYDSSVRSAMDSLLQWTNETIVFAADQYDAACHSRLFDPRTQAFCDYLEALMGAEDLSGEAAPVSYGDDAAAVLNCGF